MSFYEKLKFDGSQLIPAIIQEKKTGRVLMMAWMNRASLEKTIETGKTHFWSRSRQKFLDERRVQRPHASLSKISRLIATAIRFLNPGRTNRGGLP